MHFTVQVSELRDALSAARSVTPPSPALAAYSGVLFHIRKNRTLVVGSDGETTLAATVKVDADDDAQILLPPKPLAQFLSSIDDGVLTVEVPDEGDVVVSAPGLSPYSFCPLRTSFPLPPAPTEPPTEVDFSRLHAALQAIRPAVPAGGGGGLQLVSSPEGLLVNATDTYRLHSACLPEAGFGNFSGVALYSVLDRVSRHEVTGVWADARGRTVRFSSDELVVSSRLLAVPFPAVDGVLKPSDNHRCVRVPRLRLQAALHRLTSVAEDTPVLIEAVNGSMSISTAYSPLGSGSETFDVDFNDEVPVSFASNSQFLEDAVASHSSDLLDLWVSSNMIPVILKSSEPFALTTVVQPVRVA